MDETADVQLHMRGDYEPIKGSGIRSRTKAKIGVFALILLVTAVVVTIVVLVQSHSSSSSNAAANVEGASTPNAVEGEVGVSFAEGEDIMPDRLSYEPLLGNDAFDGSAGGPPPASEAVPIEDTQAVSGADEVAGAAVCSAATSSRQTVTLGARTYQIFVPSGVTYPAAVVFLWHGLSSDVPTIENKVLLQAAANQHKFIAVYPDAKNKGGNGLFDPAAFNGAGCCKNDATFQDVQFAEDIVASLVADGCAAASRVFSMGFSNGGFMTHRLACERNDFLAAGCSHSALIGDYGGNLANSPWQQCNSGSSSVPMLGIHGTTDSTVPINGGKNPSPLGSAQWFSFEQTMAIWSKQNSCSDASLAAQTFTDSNGATVTAKLNALCGVGQYIVTGMGHDWWGDATTKCMEHFTAHGL